MAEPTADSDVKVMFQSSTVEVLKEEEAYSLVSFVADMGGVLGLFVGFNFLMIWDFAVILGNKWNPFKRMF